MAIFSKGFMNRMDKKVSKSLIGIGRDVVEIEKKVIQEEVYDFYDNIRKGNVRNPYTRTYELIENINIKRSSKTKIAVSNDSHSPDVIRQIIKGEVNWKNSILARLSPSERARDFMTSTYNILESKAFDEVIASNLHKNGIRIER